MTRNRNLIPTRHAAPNATTLRPTRTHTRTSLYTIATLDGIRTETRIDAHAIVPDGIAPAAMCRAMARQCLDVSMRTFDVTTAARYAADADAWTRLADLAELHARYGMDIDIREVCGHR